MESDVESGLKSCWILMDDKRDLNVPEDIMNHDRISVHPSRG